MVFRTLPPNVCLRQLTVTKQNLPIETINQKRLINILKYLHSIRGKSIFRYLIVFDVFGGLESKKTPQDWQNWRFERFVLMAMVWMIQRILILFQHLKASFSFLWTRVFELQGSNLSSWNFQPSNLQNALMNGSVISHEVR